MSTQVSKTFMQKLMWLSPFSACYFFQLLPRSESLLHFYLDGGSLPPPFLKNALFLPLPLSFSPKLVICFAACYTLVLYVRATFQRALTSSLRAPLYCMYPYNQLAPFFKVLRRNQSAKNFFETGRKIEMKIGFAFLQKSRIFATIFNPDWIKMCRKYYFFTFLRTHFFCVSNRKSYDQKCTWPFTHIWPFFVSPKNPNIDWTKKIATNNK